MIPETQLYAPSRSKEEPVLCARCVMDTTAPAIVFDDAGQCTYCLGYDVTDAANPNDAAGQRHLDRLVDTIRERGSDREYDCVLGVSGGTDSTYLLLWAKRAGLRPLAVHCDNGWNTQIAVRNIQNATDRLGVDLYTHVLDWDEFRELQVAFLRASTPDADKPTDIAIRSVLYRTAAKERIRYILVGVSFRNEGKVPIFWSYGDGRYIKSVHRRFARAPLSSYPNLTLLQYVWYGFARRITQVRPLWYLPYRKQDVRGLLKNEVAWQDYGGHHHENVYTRFLHGFYLPVKFGFDKRKVEFSALIRSGQMLREDAIERLKAPPYSRELMQQDIEYVKKKLGLTTEDFAEVMSADPKRFTDYETYFPLLRRYRRLIEWGFGRIYSRKPQIFAYLDQLEKATGDRS